MSFLISTLRSLSSADRVFFALMAVFVLSACHVISRKLALAGDVLAIAFPAGVLLFMLIPVRILARIRGPGWGGAEVRPKSVSGVGA